MGSLAVDEFPNQPQVLIVGAGIMGLTAALTLKDQGYRITIVARDLPEDTGSQDFASPWAGASWDPFATEDDEDAQRREISTYRKFEELLENMDEKVLIRASNTTLLSEQGWKDAKQKGRWFANQVKGFRLSAEDEQRFLTYQTFFMSVPLYTKWILSQLSASSGTSTPVSIRRIPALSSLSSALGHEPTASILINATGLGSSSLTDVKDPSVLPIRGQTVLIKTPEFSKHPRGITSRLNGNDTLAYVIPRAKSGTTILGGTYIENSVDGEPDLKTTERILRRCAEICPEIVPKLERKPDNGNTNGSHPDSGLDLDSEPWKRIEVERVNVGFRPGRKTGPRIEIDKELQLQSSDGKKIPVLHCYGLGPAGYQTSWGIAAEVLALVKVEVPI